MKINSLLSKKLISLLLAGTLLCSAAPSYSINPRNVALAGCIAGIIVGSWIGYKNTNKETNQNSQTFTEKVKHFIQRYPILCYGAFGGLMGAGAGFGIGRLLPKFKPYEPEKPTLDELRIKAIEEARDEIAQKRQQAHDKYTNGSLEMQDFRDALAYLNGLQCEIGYRFSLAHTEQDLPRIKNNLLNDADQNICRIENTRQTIRQQQRPVNLWPQQQNPNHVLQHPIYPNPNPALFHGQNRVIGNQPPQPIQPQQPGPVSRNVLARILNEPLKKGECLQCLETKNNIRTQYCQCAAAENKHPWCEDCIRAWLGQHNNCPVCQRQII